MEQSALVEDLQAAEQAREKATEAAEQTKAEQSELMAGLKVTPRTVGTHGYHTYTPQRECNMRCCLGSQALKRENERLVERQRREATAAAGRRVGALDDLAAHAAGFTRMLERAKGEAEADEEAALHDPQLYS